MALVRLDVRFEDLDALVALAQDQHVVVSVLDADTIITLGSLHDRLTSPIGVWLELSEDYSAQMAARDVATLSWLVPLDTVVVSSESAESSAQVLEALLTNDEVNFTTASLRWSAPTTDRPHRRRSRCGVGWSSPATR